MGNFHKNPTFYNNNIVLLKYNVCETFLIDKQNDEIVFLYIYVYISS